MTFMRGICGLALASALGLLSITTGSARAAAPYGGGWSCDGGDEEVSLDKRPPMPPHCPGKLIITKAAIGGDGDFNFTKTKVIAETNYKRNDDDDGDDGEAFTLRNGGVKEFTFRHSSTFRVEEVNLPADWSIRSISCSHEDYNVEGNVVYVHVESGKTVTCTFTNFKGHDDTTRRATEVFVRRRLDNLLTNGPDRARMLRRLRPVEQLDTLKLNGDGGAPTTPAEDDSTPEQIRAARGDATITQATRSGNPLFDGIASQLVNSFQGGETRFQASLSGLRADAAAGAAREAARKAQTAGAGFEATPYDNPVYVPRSSFDIWVEGRISRYDDDTANLNRDGRFRILYVGADYVLAPGVLVGVLGEFDHTEEDIDDSTTGRIEGRGWTAGPYIGVAITDTIFLDARAAWGTSDNDIDVYDTAAGGRSGSFDTDRWLTQATLTGNHFWGAWRMSPQIGIAYGEEDFDTYVTTLGQVVQGDNAHLGQATAQIEVGYRFVTTTGTFIEPTLGIEGIWSFDSDNVEVAGVGYGTDEARAKVEAGLILSDPSGFGLRWAAAYDGIGASNYDAWEGSLWINVPLN